MSNARELALLEKWSSDGATIIPSLSSPTSPKATKFCCCPNRRRYNIKQPKLTTTLHVRNIFVDNDFNFIDDPTLNEDDSNEGGDSQEQPLTIENIKNYKRAESWPSAKRAHKYNLNNSKLLEAEVHKENLQHNAAAKEHDYDDVEEIVNNNSSKVIAKELTAKENEPGEVFQRLQQIEEGDEKWRHHKSCHNNNRNNCLTNEHERKFNSGRCATEFTHKKQLQQKQQLEEFCQKLAVRKALKQSGNEEANSATNSQTQQQTKTADIEVEKECENFKKPIANTATNEQILRSKTTSPLIQRLSEIGVSKTSLSKTRSPQQQPQKLQPEKLQHCNNCQFCFNQNCRNFSQLKQSLENTSPNNNYGSWHDSTSCGLRKNKNKMTITAATNAAHNRKCSVVSSSHNIASECDTLTLPPEQLAAPTTKATITTDSPRLLINSTKMPATPTSPIPPTSNASTPSSPLTTTVIKTTMVKRSPANESTVMTTTTTPPATSPATTPTSSSLSIEKSLAFTNNLQDVVVNKNKPSNNKCLTVQPAAKATTVASAVASTTVAAATTTTSATNTTSAPLSVKERIAALVAGNGKSFLFIFNP